MRILKAISTFINAVIDARVSSYQIKTAEILKRTEFRNTDFPTILQAVKSGSLEELRKNENS